MTLQNFTQERLREFGKALKDAEEALFLSKVIKKAYLLGLERAKEMANESSKVAHPASSFSDLIGLLEKEKERVTNGNDLA